MVVTKILFLSIIHFPGLVCIFNKQNETPQIKFNFGNLSRPLRSKNNSKDMEIYIRYSSSIKNNFIQSNLYIQMKFIP